MDKVFVSKTLMYEGNSTAIECELPESCPHCHQMMVPEFTFVGSKPKTEDGFPILFRCSNTKCKEYFAAFLTPTLITPGSVLSGRRAEIKPYTYAPSPIYDLPEEIDTISSSFREIYSQSQIAEAYGLTQISGVGFRKSIEFLVKDYLKHESITNKSGKTADGMTLSQAINLIPVERIKSLALAAAWLGNDETHYVREFNSHDVEDMKGFIKALGHEVSSIVAADKAKSLIASKGSNSPTS